MTVMGTMRLGRGLGVVDREARGLLGGDGLVSFVMHFSGDIEHLHGAGADIRRDNNASGELT